MKTIKNNIVGTQLVDRLALKEFQGDLKKNDVKELKKLINSIRKGFDSPIYLWHDHNNFILDGHQRLKALNILADKEIFLKQDKVPVVYIKANTEEDAKRKLAEYNSKYSSFDNDKTEDFFVGVDLSDIVCPDMYIAPESAGAPLPSEVGEIDDITSMSFKLTKKQKVIVKDAIMEARTAHEYDEQDTGNTNENGNALFRICDFFIKNKQYPEE